MISAFFRSDLTADKDQETTHEKTQYHYGEAELQQKRDYYRAQVHLTDKRLWAFCYNAIADKDQKTASKLRDALNKGVEDIVRTNFSTLIGAGDFVDYLTTWVPNQCSPFEEVQADARRYYLNEYGILVPQSGNGEGRNQCLI
jgi:hypothetical protein